MNSKPRNAIQQKGLAVVAAAIASLLAFAPRAAAQKVPSDLPGWEQTTWGMSRERVEELFPNRVRGPRAGESGDAVIDGVWVLGTLQEARLFFGSRGLERVFIALPRGTASLSASDALERALSEKLGPPRASKKDWDRAEISWSFPSTRVVLLYTKISHPDVAWEGLFLIFAAQTASGETGGR